MNVRHMPKIEQKLRAEFDRVITIVLAYVYARCLVFIMDAQGFGMFGI